MDLLWSDLEVSLTKEKYSDLVEDLRQGKISSSEMYQTIHEIGRENVREARPLVEHFLTNEDAQLRSIALEVLTNHWRLSAYWQTAKDFLEHDPDEDCRMRGASALQALKMNTQHRPTLAVLARVVRNEREETIVREAAYAAMKGVLHYDPREQFKLASRGTNLSQEVDWKMVDSYHP